MTVEWVEAATLSLAAVTLVAVTALVTRASAPALRGGAPPALTSALRSDVGAQRWLQQGRDRATVAPLCLAMDERLPAPRRAVVDPRAAGE